MTERNIHQNESGKTFEIQVGDILAINLPENLTTGFGWEIDNLDYQIIELQDSHLTNLEEGIGGGGTRIFKLRARSLGITKIQIILKKIWRPNNEFIERFEIIVNVRSDTV